MIKPIILSVLLTLLIGWTVKLCVEAELMDLLGLVSVSVGIGYLIREMFV